MKRITLTLLLLVLPMLPAACTTSPNTPDSPDTSKQATTEPAPAVFNSPSRSDRLIEHLADNSRHLTRLTPDYIYRRLHHRQDSKAISDAFDRLAPDDAEYRHHLEGPDDMPAHIKSVLTDTSLTIPVLDGAPDLGTWQAVYVIEHRARNHSRTLTVTFQGSFER